jgi:hypothetical protein
MIEVRIDLKDMPSPMNMDNWSRAIYDKLIAGGIPAAACGGVERGALKRFYDPKDFGVTVYQWIPDDEMRSASDRAV